MQSIPQSTLGLLAARSLVTKSTAVATLTECMPDMRKCNIMFGDQRYYGTVPSHITLAVELIGEIAVLYGPPRRVLSVTCHSEGLIVYDAVALTLTEFLDATCANYTGAHEKLIYEHESVVTAHKKLTALHHTAAEALGESFRTNTALTKERDTIANELDEVTIERNIAVDDRDALLERANSADAKVEALQREVTLARSQYEFAAARTGDQATTIAKLQEELSLMTSRLESNTKLNDELNAKYEALAYKHAVIINKRISLKNDITRLRAEWFNARDAHVRSIETCAALERKYIMMTDLQRKTYADNIQMRHDRDHEDMRYKRLLEDNLDLRNQLDSTVECVIDSM